MTKSQLPVRRRWLLELMQRTGFGRIEALVVRSGEPVLDPPPRVVREVKFGGQNGPRQELRLADFPLKAEVVELFRELDCLGDGVVDLLTIKHGLPFKMHLTVAAGAQ